MSFSKTLFTDITPPISGLSPTGPFPPFGVVWVEVARSSPNIVYACADSTGLARSTDYGNSWTYIGGTPPFSPNFGNTTTYFDSPFCIRIDPHNPNHQYVTQGVRGSTLGFWVTTDGVNFAIPAGFLTAEATIGTRDCTTFDIDPTDFNHILLGFHGAWTGLGLSNNGQLESFDGGNSWTIRMPVSTWDSATQGISFLYDPSTSQGNAQSWLIGTQGNGQWRTTNSGTSYTQISTQNIVHGGSSHLYSPNGRLFVGCGAHPLTSTDNGVTVASITSLPDWGYYGLGSDGTRLFTSLSFTGDNGGYGGGPQPMMTSLASDGLTWAAFNSQLYNDGPYNLVYNAQTGLLYASMWASGLIVLQATDPAPTVISYPGLRCGVLP